MAYSRTTSACKKKTKVEKAEPGAHRNSLDTKPVNPNIRPSRTWHKFKKGTSRNHGITAVCVGDDQMNVNAEKPRKPIAKYLTLPIISHDAARLIQPTLSMAKQYRETSR